ncbi:MAG: hypothetical protein LBC74_11600 [Planctomycetaceae bacterium]|jgi:hypothetical protein|nr:hypothetical protein [Planctomycetaceae bacterium]
MDTKKQLDFLDSILKETDPEKAYIHLSETYWKSSESIRNMIRKQWNFGIHWKIPNIIPPLHTKRTDVEQEIIIRANLLYFSISDKEGLEENDMLIDIAIIYHQCLFIGVDPTEFFDSVAEESTYKAKKLLTNFIKRSKADKSMEAFCLKTTEDENSNIDIECEFW